MQDVTISMRPALTDEQLNALFSASWPHHKAGSFAAVLSRSLGWCAAYHRDQLVGFVYVAWDGGAHAFLLSPTVHPAYRRQGLGLALVRAVIDMAAEAGSEWLHVDYLPELTHFYAAAGFRPTSAGLIHLPEYRSA